MPYLLPFWPTSTSRWSRAGLVASSSECSTHLELRNSGDFNTPYLTIRFQKHEGAEFSVEANLHGVNAADVRQVEALLKALKGLQKAVERVKADLSTNYILESDLAWFLTRLFAHIGIAEVIEYIPLAPDVKRPLVADDVRRVASQLQTLTPLRV